MAARAALVFALVVLAVVAARPASAQTPPRPTLTVSGLPVRISDQVDWSVTAAGLDATATYTMSVTLPDGLALDVSCSVRSRIYTIVQVTTYTAPPSGESLRLHPCEIGEHAVQVTLEAEDKETVRHEAVVHVDAVSTTGAVQDGFLRQPSVAEIVAARRYAQLFAPDVVIVVYHVDYGDVSTLPPAADAWWVDGQVGTRRVSSAQAVAYTREGWGHGILALSSSEAITQVTLTGMPGRYADPFKVTEAVTTGIDIGADLILALRGLATMPEWEDQELVVGEWLGSDGQAYVEAVVPGIRELAPEIYSSRIVDFAVTRFTPTARDDQGILAPEELSEFTEPAAQSLNLPDVMFRLVATLILAVIAAGAAIKMTKNGMMALPAVALVLVGGTIVGFVPLALTLTVALLAGIVIGFALFGKRA